MAIVYDTRSSMDEPVLRVHDARSRTGSLIRERHDPLSARDRLTTLL